MFVDIATIKVAAGKGGDGKLSFRHEKYRAKGGPDGGNGGRGGNVVLVVDHNLDTLASYRHQRLAEAEPGQPGGSNRRNGRASEDIILKVPPGTLVRREGSDDLLADLTTDGQQAIVARGGRGGFGNAHFASSTRQAPRLSEPGGPGEELTIRLELKLIADIGLVGLPNAGKSTLLSVISNARPEIADYPFTTLVPNLGVVDIDGTSVLVADIPGLIEGASEGKGLGDEFLRHLERTAVLWHLVAADHEDIGAAWCQVDDELIAYSSELANKPTVVVLSQSDKVQPDVAKEQRRVLEEVTGDETVAISAKAHKGLKELLRLSLPIVQEARQIRRQAEAEAAIPIISEVSNDDWEVTAEKTGGWRVGGQAMERFAERTNPDQPDSIARLRDVLKKRGIATELRRQGAQSGDAVYIGEIKLEWHD